VEESPPVEDYQDRFARIEGRVEAGDTDLSDLGFWRLVRNVKVDPRLAVHWADECGRIDRKAFEARTRVRFPVWLGNAVLLLGTGAMVALVPLSLKVARGAGAFGDVRPFPNPTLGGVLALVAAGGLSVTVHDLGHWLVGRLGRIRFLAYFLDGPFRIQPGLKIDYESYLRASPGDRAAMHAAGAIASKVAPFAVFAAVYLPHRASGYDLLPSWSLWAILGLGLLQIVTDVAWSRRYSDWKKVRRELRVGRAQEHVR
jgi:hypothetical protein